MPKEVQTKCTIALISHVSKVILEILQARLQLCVSQELPDVQAGFRKDRETRDQIANSHYIVQKAREFNKQTNKQTSVSLITWKPLTLWNTRNCGKFLKRWEYQTTWPVSWEKIFMQVKKHQLKLDMEQQTVSKLGKEYVKAEYCHPAYLTYMQSTSWKTLGWMKHSWNQDCQEKYQ